MNRLRNDTMLGVEGLLQLTAAPCFINRNAHGVCYTIGIHNDRTLSVSCRATHSLDK